MGYQNLLNKMVVSSSMGINLGCICANY
ncbi:hypothetical protein ACMD2_25845 [Ananas comosus]|uniref:Uncharacterized protein n=1 Tax=Ananas comosus TaxID=4615 RepID=A0A199VAS4_ANACO|nr:hypothetical protein ACMD2_25845 [Ananas comosus]